jgi:flagellar biogenesis protein FliO
MRLVSVEMFFFLGNANEGVHWLLAKKKMERSCNHVQQVHLESRRQVDQRESIFMINIVDP